MFYELEHISSADYFKKMYCENFSFPPHMHNCFEIVVSLEGESRIIIDGNAYSIKKGEAVFIFPHQLHSFLYSKGRHMICIFSPQIISEYYEANLKYKPINNKFLPDSKLVMALNDYECNSQRLFEKGVLYLLCNEFDKRTAYEENLNKSLLEKIFIYINMNYTDKCSLSDIAQNIGYNSSYLSRYFKKCVGIKLFDYITMLRLSNACHLYESTNNTILSCAIDSGFDSIRTFNRNFKKNYGLSPIEYFKSKK